MDVKAEHLDADSSALVRSEKLRWLNDATRSNESRMISNVQLFTEGVDVPALDTVSFLDPRKSHVDIVQSVGRVMRKAEGKQFGYIVVPVPLDEGEDVADKLSKRGDDYRAVGQVLRALQSHDERLAETPASFVSAHPGPARYAAPRPGLCLRRASCPAGACSAPQPSRSVTRFFHRRCCGGNRSMDSHN